jgi:hypothetical protein
MNRPLRKIVAWITLGQVGLVGAMGTGLHSLFGCEHGAACAESCCTAGKSSCSQHGDCLFCELETTVPKGCAAKGRSGEGLSRSTHCDGCAVCDLLAQYHTAAPFVAAPLASETSQPERAVEVRNAVVAAATRLALSRAPPAV